MAPTGRGSALLKHTRSAWEGKPAGGRPAPRRGEQRNKEPPGLQPGGSMDEIRRHLLSHFGYYHRLGKLNYRVRDGNGCGLSDMVTGKKRAAREGAARLVVVA